MATDKEPTEKIFCLFHRKVDCNCITPVTENKALNRRLKNGIKLNQLNNKFDADLEVKAQREIEIEDFQARMEPVRDLKISVN